MLKYLHVMLGTALLGMIIAAYFHIVYAIQQQQTTTLQKSLRNSFFSDAFILLLIPAMFASGTMLVHSNHIAMTTPWIKAAYLLMGICFFTCIAISIIKIINFRQLIRNHYQNFQFQKIFHTLTIFLWLCFIAIIHDAVFQHTFLFK